MHLFHRKLLVLIAFIISLGIEKWFDPNLVLSSFCFSRKFLLFTRLTTLDESANQDPADEDSQKEKIAQVNPKNDLGVP